MLLMCIDDTYMSSGNKAQASVYPALRAMVHELSLCFLLIFAAWVLTRTGEEY